MNINPATAYSAYKNIERQTSGTHPAVRPETTAVAASKNENTDQIQISSEGSRQLEIERLSQSILSEIKTPASAERLEGLKSAVQDKTYHIPTATLVDTMMGHWFGR